MFVLPRAQSQQARARQRELGDLLDHVRACVATTTTANASEPSERANATMSDASLWHLAEGISCHAWNKDRSKVALCPNSNEIWIFSGCHQPDATKWRKEAVLTEVRPCVSVPVRTHL